MPKKKTAKKPKFDPGKPKTWPEWMTVTPQEGSCLTMKAREMMENKIVESCNKKATLEKNAAKPIEQQLQRFDKDRCWYAAYSACMRWVLKNI
jgi:hypothetical protein